MFPMIVGYRSMNGRLGNKEQIDRSEVGVVDPFREQQQTLKVDRFVSNPPGSGNAEDSEAISLQLRYQARFRPTLFESRPQTELLAKPQSIYSDAGPGM
jgi:hypothetical protein